MTTFDFEDGKGPVPAHQHPNGDGWVADEVKRVAKRNEWLDQLRQAVGEPSTGWS